MVRELEVTRESSIYTEEEVANAFYSTLVDVLNDHAENAELLATAYLERRGNAEAGDELAPTGEMYDVALKLYEGVQFALDYNLKHHAYFMKEAFAILFQEGSRPIKRRRPTRCIGCRARSTSW